MRTCFLIFGIYISLVITATEFHVSKNGNNSNSGSSTYPFLTIQRAVREALPGDTITVHEGIYREWVNPIRGGESDTKRIVYRAAPGEKVEIKGSEVIDGWEKIEKDVWKRVLPNAFFGEYNPYKDSVHGDWFHDLGRLHHTGEVFLNGKSLYEKESLHIVLHPVSFEKSKDKEGSTYVWYCESDEENTTIWANFHEFNPNKEMVEISTRRTCFYPDTPSINYITIQGFHFSQAATQWGAPTAGQVGMIATHWNKGWIIENNVISDSKCSGITLGKERETGHNVWSADAGNINRDGNIHYIEVVFNVLRNNWDKEHVGSHIVRNNTIFNCEQTGICGSMGAVFSTIENNHIYNIWTKRQFSGYEIGGIKFHAPVDALIRKNRIHNCGRGLWLDWMTQGTRVSGNLFYNNDLEDLFIEVNHGPYIIDNNILLSDVAIRNWSQGGAYIHNLIAGRMKLYYDPNRFTPYFLPHSIDMAGLTLIRGGDDRFFNNIFTGTTDTLSGKGFYGLSGYDETFLPVYLDGNVFYYHAIPSVNDSNLIAFSEFNPEIVLEEKGESMYLHFTPDPAFSSHRVNLISSSVMGWAKIPKAAFDRPDGSNLTVDTDYYANPRKGETTVAGPFSEIKNDKTVIQVW